MTRPIPLIAPKLVPPLDPDFRPASLANRAYRNDNVEEWSTIGDRFGKKRWRDFQI